MKLVFHSSTKENILLPSRRPRQSEIEIHLQQIHNLFLYRKVLLKLDLSLWRKDMEVHVKIFSKNETLVNRYFSAEQPTQVCERE